MPRTRQPGEEASERTLAARIAAAFVAVLFFTPVLVLLWLFANLQFAWSDAWLPGKALAGCILAAAVLGFALPRATPTVFGWIAGAFYRLAKLWYP